MRTISPISLNRLFFSSNFSFQFIFLLTIIILTGVVCSGIESYWMRLVARQIDLIPTLPPHALNDFAVTAAIRSWGIALLVKFVVEFKSRNKSHFIAPFFVLIMFFVIEIAKVFLFQYKYNIDFGHIQNFMIVFILLNIGLILLLRFDDGTWTGFRFISCALGLVLHLILFYIVVKELSISNSFILFYLIIMGCWIMSSLGLSLMNILKFIFRLQPYNYN